MFLTFFFGCEHTKYIDSAEYIYETEPNDFPAFEITEGNIYAAEIAKPQKDAADTDIFKIWLPSGTLITFEFESREENFEPYIAHTDNLGNYTFAVFKVPGKRQATFVTTADGWQYFEIGDKRNTGSEKKVGGFKYYFRVITSHICDVDNYEKIELNSTVKRVFSQSGKHVDILEPVFEKSAVYQINVDTKNMLSDKFSFVMNCGSREIVAGNDDEDYYSNKIDPLIYSRLEGNLRHLLVTGRMLLDLDETEEEIFNVSFIQQPESEELEPNDTFNYANVTDSSNISGYLDTEKKNILGEESDDEDWFRFKVEKGDILSVKITPENPNPFIAEIWGSSYNITGSGLIALRASMLSGTETHNINMLSPFNGDIYLDLLGRDVPYSLEISRENEIETFDSSAGDLEIELPDCGWKFFKWIADKEKNLAEITLSVPGNLAGLYIFDSDLMPFAMPDPAETVRFFSRKYEKTENLIFGLYINECEQNSGQKLHLSIEESVSVPEKWTHGTGKTPVKITTDTAYFGYFDTGSDFYENFFEFTAERDGTVYISTSPDRESTVFDIDTVMTLLHDGTETVTSDDMISTLHFNKYSFITHEVKAGETYTIKITPFMSESSNISAMNINGYYILDLYLK
ncbi:hypothetical protein J5681_02990 [bacterium]|nr:hypothetical protein [bacterium]